MDEKQIIENAIKKHNLTIDIQDKNIFALVRYVFNIGYSEGIKDNKPKNKKEIK